MTNKNRERNSYELKGARGFKQHSATTKKNNQKSAKAQKRLSKMVNKDLEHLKKLVDPAIWDEYKKHLTLWLDVLLD